MAYTHLTTTTVGTAANSVAFTGISQSYQHLHFIIHAGSTGRNSSSAQYGFDNLSLSTTGVGSGNYSYTYSRWNYDGAWIGQTGSDSTSKWEYNYVQYANDGSSDVVMNHIEVYLPNYTDTNQDQVGFCYSTCVWPETSGGISSIYWGQAMTHCHMDKTSALSAFTFESDVGNFIVGSTFSLYGIAGS